MKHAVLQPTLEGGSVLAEEGPKKISTREASGTNCVRRSDAVCASTLRATVQRWRGAAEQGYEELWRASITGPPACWCPLGPEHKTGNLESKCSPSTNLETVSSLPNSSSASGRGCSPLLGDLLAAGLQPLRSAVRAVEVAVLLLLRGGVPAPAVERRARASAPCQRWKRQSLVRALPD